MSAIPTARGDEIPAEDLGFTLPVELIFQESPEISLNWPDHSWGARSDEEWIAIILDKLRYAKEIGVDTIMDRVIPGIGRNVPRLKQIAERTPINILVMTGWYTRYEFPYYFRYREAFPQLYPGEPTLEDFMVRDLEEGILDTGVRAAAIKVMSDYHGIRETVDVLNVFRHASRAHRRTGAPIYTHSNGVMGARLQQEVFLELGVDMSRVAYGHLDRTLIGDYFGEFERLAEGGSYLSFDGWFGTGGENIISQGASGPEDNIDRVVKLIEAGYVEQVLLSNCTTGFDDSIPAVIQGDFPAYSQLTLDIIPKLKERGVTDEQIRTITVENPRRLLDYA
jgi:phosphotriesterase-related protein